MLEKVIFNPVFPTSVLIKPNYNLKNLYFNIFVSVLWCYVLRNQIVLLNIGKEFGN